jgi:hypothetical protein
MDRLGEERKVMPLLSCTLQQMVCRGVTRKQEYSAVMILFLNLKARSVPSISGIKTSEIGIAGSLAASRPVPARVF